MTPGSRLESTRRLDGGQADRLGPATLSGPLFVQLAKLNVSLVQPVDLVESLSHAGHAKAQTHVLAGDDVRLVVDVRHSGNSLLDLVQQRRDLNQLIERVDAGK